MRRRFRYPVGIGLESEIISPGVACGNPGLVLRNPVGILSEAAIGEEIQEVYTLASESTLIV